MKTTKIILTAVAVAAIIAASLFGYGLVQAKRKEYQKAMAGQRDLSVAVQTAKVGRTHIDEILTFNGDVEALQSVNLQPKVSGRLLTLQLDDGTPVEEGVHVNQNQLVATIDDRELKALAASAMAAQAAAKAAISVASANVTSAKAALLNAKAALEQRTETHKSSLAAIVSAKAALDDKTREKNRQQKLLATQATTQQSYDQAVTAYDQAVAALSQAQATAAANKAQITSAQADIQEATANIERFNANVVQANAALQQADANLEQANVKLSETRLFSPMNGVVASKCTDPGSMISPTTTIVNILDMDVVKVVISVPVNQLPKILPGKTKARMKTASMPDKYINCEIRKIYPAVETTTRTAQVEIRVNNFKDKHGSYQLKPGMYVTVEVLIESRDNVLAVDSALPIRNLQQNIVFKVNDSKALAVDVKLGVRFHDKVEILAGLNEGDEIVVVGQHRLTDGSTLRILPGNNLALDPNKVK